MGGVPILLIEPRKCRNKAARLQELKNMATEVFATIAGRAVSYDQNDLLHQRKRRWTTAFMISTALGTLAGGSGLGVNALFLVQLIQDQGPIRSLSTLLLVIAFPLLYLGAHCLDKADMAERAIRREYCRKHGLLADR